MIMSKFLHTESKFQVTKSNFEILSRNVEILSRNFELLSRNFELLSRNFELLSRNFELPYIINKNMPGSYILPYILLQENIVRLWCVLNRLRRLAQSEV